MKTTNMGTIAYYGEGEVDLQGGDKYVKNGRLPGDYSIMNGPGKVKALSNSKTSLQSSETSDKVQLNGYASTHSLAEFEERTITISLQPADRRFGFSVMGGSDEGFPARIDEISEGSPASRTALCINDELVEVNGNAIEDATHAEVIIQIHKCIQKRIITLKIRRYTADQVVLNHNHNYIKQTHGETTLDPGAIINEGFTREMSVDREITSDLNKNRAQPVATPTSTQLPNYTNQAFDEEDEPSDTIEIPSDGPRTLAYPSFLALLEHIKGKLPRTEDREDMNFLRNLFNSQEFNSAVVEHNDLTKIQAARKAIDDMKPVATNSQFLLAEVRLLLLGIANDELADELLSVINNHYLQGVLIAHDRIAMRETLDSYFDSDISNDGSGGEDDDDFDADSTLVEEQRVKIVRIDKTVDPLGATVRNEGDAVVISRVVKGGAAEKSGLLHEGDEILEINGNPVKGKNVNEVVELLSELDGTLTFLIIPGDGPIRSSGHESSIFMRAQFDYDPQDDDYNPCQELGLRFRKGDILEILNQEDPDWWQARKVDEDSGLARLIPSKLYQQQREARRVMIPENQELPSKQKRRCFCIRGKKKRAKKRNILDSGNPENPGIDDILTYEEMVQVDPDPELKRPIVMIGPAKVGRRELREKLIKSNPSRFAPAVPHTSRPPRLGEVDGRDYYFIPQDDFEADIMAQKFAEYGQSDGFYYGTSLDEIRGVCNADKVCVLNLHCQALPILKASDLKPYIIFVTLPSFDQLRRLRGTSEQEPFNPNVRLKDDELMDIIDRAREMDINYAHYFDYTIINKDINMAYEELVKVANYLETQPQWMPASWTR